MQQLLQVQTRLDADKVYIQCYSSVDPDLRSTSDAQPVGSSRHYHVYFLPGNPGCIAYYHAYLTLLAEKLGRRFSGTTAVSFELHGASFPNFTDPATEVSPESTDSTTPALLSLQDQIAAADGRLGQAVAEKASKLGPAQVILIGHSVGGYVGLELIRLRALSAALEPSKAVPLQIVGFVGLFPTLTHIVQSPSGRKLGVGIPRESISSFVIADRRQWLLRLPFFATTVGFLVRFLKWLLGTKLLHSIVGRGTGFPEDAVQVTTDFLTSRRGVEQALCMARDEMNEIGEDRWNEDVWISANAIAESQLLRQTVLYFGEDDHWVAKHLRDQLIAQRSNANVRMLIDTDEIPHSFCIRHSRIIAEKTAGWIEEIIGHQNLNSERRS